MKTLKVLLLLSPFLLLFLVPGQTKAQSNQCGNTGEALNHSANCCGVQVETPECQGLSPQCNSLAEFRQCPGRGCGVGIASNNCSGGTGMAIPVPQAPVSFLAAACKRDNEPDINVWLRKKLAEKLAQTPKLDAKK